MSMNSTPRSNRVHIALFGKRNAGKSSLINAITKQETAVVSPVKGTTTDPVYKSMELLPLGPVVFIDTAGLDDEGELGELRKRKTLEVVEKTDLALLVVDAEEGLSDFDISLAAYLRQKKIPSLGVLNKIDLEAGSEPLLKEMREKLELSVYAVSAASGKGINELRKAMGEAVPDEEDKFKIVGDLVRPGDFVVLVTPIDKAAPKGRLILPQQQTIRDILEADAIAVVTKEYELKETLERLGTKPALVITDSQAFLKVAADTPKDVPLTSFSILFARHKGDLAELVRGARALDKLQDGDKILVAEACTHHQQSDDIGRVKIPRWIRQNTGKELHFEHASGYTFPGNITDYSLIVHCGSCMLNRRSMLHRIAQAVDAGVPIVNYGVLIAYVQGIFPRAIDMFPLARLEWDEA
ncbi:[FeFe] hydrogenase H-cluster maturation GTPase HydF [Paenibacillus mesotrionivorans]|uniref:[FeFe] hydrogenase H-cluster maturation GTPase HydF n=1 Tax=Paenibacillus mesotrionivorans TaxID=3160968 RepID=A0ACC7P105_9BACL